MRRIHGLIDEQIQRWEQTHGAWLPSRERRGGMRTAAPPVIALCPQLGCGSRLVTNILSLRTGYEIFGFRLIDEVAEDMHARRRLIDQLDQRGHSYIQNLIEGLLRGRHVEQAEYFQHLVHVLRVFIQKGGCILVGRGAPFLVEEGAGIRVHLTASPEKRIENLMRFYGIGEEEAEARMQTSDQERSEFARKFYGKELGNPLDYDLCLSLDRMSPETAVGCIMRALEVMPCERRLALRPIEGDAARLVERQMEKWRARGFDRDAREDDEDEPAPARLPVAALSPSFCSGSRLVCQALQAQLGYEVFGYRLIDRVAEDTHLSPRILEGLDQKTQSAIQSLVESLLRGRRLQREEYFQSLVRTIRALIVQGGVVLLGRGSTVLVEEKEGLRARLVAPMEKRLENMEKFYGKSGPAAREELLRGDRERANFIRQYYGAELSDTNQFDITFNLERTSPSAVADVIRRALEPLVGQEPAVAATIS